VRLQVFAEAAEHSEDGVIDELMTKAS